MLNNSKRKFLTQTIATIGLTLAGSLNKLFAEWREELFSHKDLSSVMSLLTNETNPSESDKINIKAPEIAENGAVVPITVNTTIDNVKNIAIIVDNNPSPLTSSYKINPALEAYVSTRVKMAKTSNIIALVSTTNNEFFTASKGIKVTIGGCGG